MVTLSGNFARADAAVVEELGQLGGGLLADSMQGRNVMSSRLRPLGPGMSVAGPALPCLVGPGDNLCMHIALRLARPGDVIVITAPVAGSTGMWGELATTSAMARGVAAVVADGAVRDTAEIRELGFPLWSAERSPRGAGKSEFGSVCAPVSCGGTVVSPGDVVVGDEDGLVVVPLSELDEILAAAKARREREGELRAKLAAGVTTFELLGLADELAAIGVEIADD